MVRGWGERWCSGFSNIAKEGEMWLLEQFVEVMTERKEVGPLPLAGEPEGGGCNSDPSSQTPGVTQWYSFSPCFIFLGHGDEKCWKWKMGHSSRE